MRDYIVNYSRKPDARHGEVLTDDLQIHTIELPKYQRPTDNKKIVDLLEEWVYFLRFAAESTADELARVLADEEFAEAIGVLQMIAQSPAERALYEARLKLQRDEEARLIHAQQEGEARGKRIGRIQLLQQLLGMKESSRDELAQLDLTALEAMAEDLQEQLRSRG